ncbi:MAG: aspartate/glutamate racemase family protein [Spirochaetaceae bacterium]|nr:MAG: aspartate/glutamate racemase family protein [Spirochaetaceae bacterium]
MDRPLILIGGGVGPMAGVELHRRIIENTRTNGTDQDHLEVLHLSRSHLVGDRTDFLAGIDVPDPAAGMARVFRMAAGVLQSEDRRALAGVPCNTFHAPRIFNPFVEEIGKLGLPLRVVNMIDETKECVFREFPRSRRVGLLSTTGTRATGVYRDALLESEMELVQIPESEQPFLHEAIYNLTWGLKAVSPPDARALERVERYAVMLAESGAEVIILGCTELPLALAAPDFRGIPLLDPLTVLARALVRATAPEKLLPTGEGEMQR